MSERVSVNARLHERLKSMERCLKARAPADDEVRSQLHDMHLLLGEFLAEYAPLELPVMPKRFCADCDED